MNTLDKNILISNFIGIEFGGVDKDEEIVGVPDVMKYTKIGGASRAADLVRTYYPLDQALKFNEDWNWLMVVYGEIKKLPFNSKIDLTSGIDIAFEDTVNFLISYNREKRFSQLLD